MEKQLAQIMLDTMHLVGEPLEKRVAELEAQVREFKYVSTWEAEQYKERQLRLPRAAALALSRRLQWRRGQAGLAYRHLGGLLPDCKRH
jgi:hypothetical protein